MGSLRENAARERDAVSETFLRQEGATPVLKLCARAHGAHSLERDARRAVTQTARGRRESRDSVFPTHGALTHHTLFSVHSSVSVYSAVPGVPCTALL